jgi:hypothetical protein
VSRSGSVVALHGSAKLGAHGWRSLSRGVGPMTVSARLSGSLVFFP